MTAPPFHVWCGSTTIPYFDDDFDQIGERAARGADGKTYHVPADMTYKEWEKSFVKEQTEVSASAASENVQNYKPVEVSKEITNIQRKGNNINARKIITANNDVYVSENIKLKPKQLHNIDNNISAVKKLLSITGSVELPKIYIINSAEMGSNALASYNPLKNVMFFDEKMGVKDDLLKLQEQFAAKGDEISTYLHEFLHWQDAREYAKKHGELKTAEDFEKYLNVLNKKAKNELDKLEKEGYNISEISVYAEKSFKDKNYDEVYTEYRVRQILQGDFL